MWKASPIVGHHRFWGIVDAMRKAGLVTIQRGIRFPSKSRGYDGAPAVLQALQALFDLAEGCGATEGTSAQDWPIVDAVYAQPPRLTKEGLVICRRLGADDPGPAKLPPDQVEKLEALREYVAKLNDAVEKAKIRGCLPPVFRRIFKHDLRLGGRLYSIGHHSMQSLSSAERGIITINGAAVAELDIHASHLSMFLALTGTKELPESDLYAVGGLPREVVKAWLVQTFANGRPARRWARKTAETVREVQCSAAQAAVETAYPAFRQPLDVILPPDLRDRVPRDALGWAVGQYLAFRESEVIQAAIGRILEMTGHVALPVHDSLIVPASIAAFATDCLKTAFDWQAEVYPKIKRKG